MSGQALPDKYQHSGSSIQRIGVIGGGQLAWMMAREAKPLGIDLVVQTPSLQDPAVPLASHTILATVEDAEATAELAAQCDAITFENEFVDLEALSHLEAAGVCFRPQLKTLRPLLDKYHQRSCLESLGIPTPRFVGLDAEFTPDQLESAIADIGFPLVLKTRRHGYDGQGTFVLADHPCLDDQLSQLTPQPILLEEFIPFESELAVMAVRSATGEQAIYPVVETQQKNQICHRVFAPVELTSELEEQIHQIATTLLDNLEVIGIIGIELFLTEQGKVLVNEIAPRTHNSGHYTLDACHTSQFEQQLRAVAGLPLGNPELRCQQAAMVNLLGYESTQSDYLHKRQQLSQLPGAHVHWYGKAEARPSRKLGHVTIVLSEHGEKSSPNPDAEMKTRVQQVESIWYST